MLDKITSDKDKWQRQLTLLCFALLLTLLAPLRVLCQPLSAYVSDCGEMTETMDCCAMVQKADQPMSCCCEAPVTPGNMQTGATPSTAPKFIPIKSQGALQAPVYSVLMALMPSQSVQVKVEPRTTKLPLYLRLRSLLI